MTRATFAVTQTTDNVTADRVTSGTYNFAGLEVDKPPRFKFEVVNPAGVEMYKFASGKEVSIKRNGQREFIGIVETPTGIEGEGVTRVTVEGVHTGYHLLRSAECTNYDFDEDGSPSTDRDAVTVNPWATFILRHDDGTVDEYGNTKPIDGITVDEYVHNLLGTKFVHQHQFEDNSYLLSSQANARGTGTSYLTVYRDGKTGDVTPALQRYRNGDAFLNGGTVESVPLYNNDRNVSRMGVIQSAQVLIVGQRTSRVFNNVLGQDRATTTSLLEDSSGHVRTMIGTGSPTTRNAVTLTKYNLGQNLDGSNDAYFAGSDQVFNATGSFTYFFAGILDAVPTGSNRAYLGGRFDDTNPAANQFPWAVYVDSNGRVNYDHYSEAAGGNVNFQTNGADIVAGTEFRVYVRRDIGTGAVTIGVNRSIGAGSLYDYLFDPVSQAPSQNTIGLFIIGTDSFTTSGRYFVDGGVWEARFWSKPVNLDTLDRISDNASTDYKALLEGTEEAAWFMHGETDSRVTSFTAQDPTLKLCRNAVEPTRTYTSVTLTRTGNYMQSGLEAWTGSITFSGSEVNKNALGYEVTLPGPTSDPSSTKIYYVKVICVTTPDTGLTAGTIDTYDNPFDFNGEENWVATDMQGFNRLEAMEKLRRLTEADIEANPNPHWDIWIDDDLALHFMERRGTLVSGYHNYSFAAKNLKKVSHEFYGGELAYQTIAFGAGSGNAQTRIVSKQAYTDGGLYDADRDPNGVTKRYGRLPRINKFVDSNEVSAVALLRKARADHRLKRDPIENVVVEITNQTIQFAYVGDSAIFKNLKTRTNGPLRIVNFARSWSGSDREKVTVEIGQKYVGFLDDIGSGRQQTRTISIHSQPNDGVTGLSGDGLYFTTSKYGVYNFAIQDGRAVDRVFLDINTLPWQITARGSATSDHTHAASVVSSSGGAGSTDAQGLSTGATPSVAIGARTSISVTGTFSSWTTLAFFNAESTTPDFITGFLFFYNNSADRHNVEYEVRVVKASDSTVVAGTTYTNPTDLPTPQTADDTIFGIGGFSEKYNTNLVNAAQYNVQVRVRTILASPDFTDDFGIMATTFYKHTHDRLDHSHVISVAASGGHQHGLLFGIWQFDGDTGTGDGNPVYGTGIKLAVDPPTVSSVGLPTNFDAERVPIKFGTKDRPQSILIDITGYLKPDSNGAIASGVHKVFFLAEQGDTSGVYSNLQGLAVVAVTPVLTFRSQQEVA